MGCAAEFGEVTVDNLGTLNPNLAGNIVALGSSALIHAVFSLANPQNYDSPFQLVFSVKVILPCGFSSALLGALSPPSSLLSSLYTNLRILFITLSPSSLVCGDW